MVKFNSMVIENKKHLNIQVYGRVQRVGFRFNTKWKADKLGLVGFVKNEPDGSVHIEIEGPKEILEEFVVWSRKGAMFSKVKRIEKEEGKLKNFKKFKIVY